MHTELFLFDLFPSREAIRVQDSGSLSMSSRYWAAEKGRNKGLDLYMMDKKYNILTYMRRLNQWVLINIHYIYNTTPN